MSEQPTQRPARIAALISLIDRLLANPLTAHLVTDSSGIWQAGLYDVGLVQHADPETADEVLRVVGDLIGAEFVAGQPVAHGEGLVTYEAKGMWAGSPVHMSLFAPGRPVEQQLRDRVAELEAELAAKAATE